MLQRTFALAMLASGIAIGSMVATSSAEDRKPAADRGTGAKSGSAFNRTVQGRIVAVDASKRQLVVKGMLGAATGGNREKGTLDKGTGTRDKPGAGRGTTPERRPGAGSGAGAGEDRRPVADRTSAVDRNAADRDTADRTGAGRTGTAPARENTFTFMVADNSRVTLDGKPADMKDLRVDYWVRVTARQAAVRGGLGSGDDATGGRAVVERPREGDMRQQRHGHRHQRHQHGCRRRPQHAHDRRAHRGVYARPRRLPRPNRPAQEWQARYPLRLFGVATNPPASPRSQRDPKG